MQDWASSGVRKLEEALGAAGASARRRDEDACGFIVGANASMDEAKAARMKRLYGDALMVLSELTQRRAGRGSVGRPSVLLFWLLVVLWIPLLVCPP